MLNKSFLLFEYYNKVKALGIDDTNIYYSNTAELNLFFIIDESYEKFENKIEEIISDSYEKHFDKKTDTALLSFLPISRFELELSGYKLACETIFKKTSRDSFTDLHVEKEKTVKSNSVGYYTSSDIDSKASYWESKPTLDKNIRNTSQDFIEYKNDPMVDNKNIKEFIIEGQYECAA